MPDPAEDDERGSEERGFEEQGALPARGAAARHGLASLGRRVQGGAKAGLGALTDRLVDRAARVPVRDLAALRRQFPGLGPDEIADKLIAGASAGTATVGAGVGAAAALPVPPAMTAELVGETVAVVLVEYKLIAELHEVYGLRAPGTAKQRVAAYLGAWTHRRGIRVTSPATFDAALSGQLKRQLRQRLVRRSARNLPTLTPFMVGAAIGAMLNRRSTLKLAEIIRADLQAQRVPWEALPPGSDAPPLPGSDAP